MTLQDRVRICFMSIILGFYLLVADGINTKSNKCGDGCYSPGEFLVIAQGYAGAFLSLIFAIALFFKRNEKDLATTFLHILAIFIPTRFFATLTSLNYYGANQATADSVIFSMTSIGIAAYQIYFIYQLLRVIKGNWYDTSQFALKQRTDVIFTEIVLAVWLLISDAINYGINYDNKKKTLCISLIVSGCLFFVVVMICATNIFFWNNVTRFSRWLFATTLACGLLRFIVINGFDININNAVLAIFIALLQIYILFDCIRMYYIAKKEDLQNAPQDKLQEKVQELVVGGDKKGEDKKEDKKADKKEEDKKNATDDKP